MVFRVPRKVLMVDGGPSTLARYTSRSPVKQALIAFNLHTAKCSPHERFGDQQYVVLLLRLSPPRTNDVKALTIIRKVLRSSTVSRWHTVLYPVKPDIAAPCRTPMVAAAPTTDPGAANMNDDAWATRATRHARRAMTRTMITCGVRYVLLALFRLVLSIVFTVSLPRQRVVLETLYWL